MRRLLFVSAIVALAACGGGENGPQPGQLTVQLNGQPAKAVILRIVGPIASVTAATGVQMYTEETGTETIVAIFVAPSGQTLPAALGRINVADVNNLTQYSAMVLQGAGPTYAILGAQALSATITR